MTWRCINARLKNDSSSGIKMSPSTHQTALAQRIIVIMCLGQVTFTTCTNYFTPGRPFFIGRIFIHKHSRLSGQRKPIPWRKIWTNQAEDFSQFLQQQLLEFPFQTRVFLPNQNNNSDRSHNSFEYNFTFLINYRCNFQNIIPSITEKSKSTFTSE